MWKIEFLWIEYFKNAQLLTGEKLNFGKFYCELIWILGAHCAILNLVQALLLPTRGAPRYYAEFWAPVKPNDDTHGGDDVTRKNSQGKPMK